MLRHDGLRPSPTSARVDVNTHVPGKTWSRRRRSKASKARNVSLDQRRQRRAVAHRRPRRARRARSVDATALFPFAENSYAFFTGSCKYASPTRTSRRTPNYFAHDEPGGGAPRRPGPEPAAGVTVRQPPFNVRVMRATRSTAPLQRRRTSSVYATLQKPTQLDRDLCRADLQADDQAVGHELGRGGAQDGRRPRREHATTGCPRPAPRSTRACRSATTSSACATRSSTAA